MMAESRADALLEEQIAQWRGYLLRRQAIHSVDVAELEDHLREQVAALRESGLDTEEAFLVAVKRLGAQDELSREFAREHSDRLWKQLVVAGAAEPGAVGIGSARKDAFIAFGLAVVAALLIKLPALFGFDLDEDAEFYALNLSILVLPVLAGYFIWKRQLSTTIVRWIAAAFVLATVFANAYPFETGGSTQILTALHLPIVLWLVVGVAYAGERWRQVSGRMDFIRFSGELLIYYVLIALGGGVLIAFMAMIFQAIGIDVEPLFEQWILPAAAGSVIVASWLVEAKQSVIENMAPVLTRLFTPLFAAVLVTWLGTLLWTGRGVDIERDVLIAFDILLVIVLALVLYSISARDHEAPAGVFDVLQVVLVISALLADAVALWAIGSRISEFGLTPNRVAALGENIVLLVNLSWTAALYIGFLRHRRPFSQIDQWQTDYLPVYAVWAALVVIVFPPLFSFM